MSRDYSTILDPAAVFFEAIGALIIIATSGVVLVRMVKGLILQRSFAWSTSRHLLGRGLVLGLEFLIGADILRTIIAPTFDDLTMLSVVVIIRTVLSISIEFELTRLRTEGEGRDE
ncbi:MAG: DUF1622 domain-containing protein [Chloroflexota bacterium]|jgi:uncharacterized membrane protein